MWYNNAVNRLYLRLFGAAAGAVQSADPGTVTGTDHHLLRWRLFYMKDLPHYSRANHWLVKLCNFPDLNAANGHLC